VFLLLLLLLPLPQVLHGVGATRDIGNKLTHEEPQKPSDLPDELKPSHPGRAMDSDDKKVSLPAPQWHGHCAVDAQDEAGYRALCMSPI
jgi:hypothetical protein